MGRASRRSKPSTDGDSLEYAAALNELRVVPARRRRLRAGGGAVRPAIRN